MYPSSSERIDGINPMRRDRAAQSQQKSQPKQNNHYSRSLTIVKQTIAKRRVLKWLPVLCENDLVHGSWWLVWGSVLAILIPVVPLVNLYLPFASQLWPIPYKNLIALPDHTAVYAVLIGCGLFFLLGSICLVRFFAGPKTRPKPIFPCMFCQTDAVLSSWCFFLGNTTTMTTILTIATITASSPPHNPTFLLCVARYCSHHTTLCSLFPLFAQ